MFHYIYQITNNVNGKIYVGIHSSNKENDRYFGSGIALVLALKKYGKENFSKEILKFFSSRAEALLGEAEIVTEDFCRSDLTYNIAKGGIGGIIAGTMSDEHRLAISLSKRGTNNPSSGGLTEKHKQTLSVAMKNSARRGSEHPLFGKELSDAVKKKIGEKSKINYAKRKKRICGTARKKFLCIRMESGMAKNVNLSTK